MPHPNQQTVPHPPVTLADLAAGLNQIISGVGQLGALLVDLINSRVMCHRCVDTRLEAERRGVPEDQLPGVNPVALIIAGNGVCVEHRSPLILPGR